MSSSQNETFHNINERTSDGLLREVVLVLGGAFAARGTDDQTIRDVANGLDRIIDRHFHSAEDKRAEVTPESRNLCSPHPAIADLLKRISSPKQTLTASTGPGCGWSRLPGLFRRWEIEQAIDLDEEYLVEKSGHCLDGVSLFAIYTRAHAE